MSRIKIKTYKCLLLSLYESLYNGCFIVHQHWGIEGIHTKGCMLEGLCW